MPTFAIWIWLTVVVIISAGIRVAFFITVAIPYTLWDAGAAWDLFTTVSSVVLAFWGEAIFIAFVVAYTSVGAFTEKERWEVAVYRIGY